MCEPIRPAPPVTRTVAPSSLWLMIDPRDPPGAPREVRRSPGPAAVGHLGEQRQREAVAADPLGDGEVARLMLQVGVGLLEVDRHRVVQAGLDAPGLQLAADAVALGMQDDEEVPDVAPARGLDGQLQRQPAEPFAVALGQPAAGLGPAPRGT